VAPREHLDRQDPAYPENRGNLGRIHNTLVGLYRMMGQLAPAETAFQTCKAIMADLLSREPSNARYLMILGSCHQNMALVYGAKDRIVEAEAANQTAVDLFQVRIHRPRVTAVQKRKGAVE
jgi:hypothetical protein